MKFLKPLSATFILLFLLVYVMPSASADPGTVTWDGDAGDGLWSSQSNWSGNTLPLAGDDIIIPSNETVHVDTSVLIEGTLDVGYNAILYVDGSKTFTLRSTLSSTAFDFNSSSSLVNNGTIDLEDGQLSTQGADFINNGTFNVLEDPGDFTIRGAAYLGDVTNNGLILIEGSVSSTNSNFENAGDIVIDGMFLDWYGASNQHFFNYVGAEIRGTGILNIGSMNSPDAATGPLYNFGTIDLNPRGFGLDPDTMMRVYTDIYNTGTIDTNSGDLLLFCEGDIDEAGTFTGNLEVMCRSWTGGGSTDDWSNRHNWNADETPVSGEGKPISIRLPGSNPHLDVDFVATDSIYLSSKLTVDGGKALTVSDEMTNHGEFEVIGSALISYGVVFDNHGLVTIPGALSNYGTFNNNDTINISGTFYNHEALNNPGTIINDGLIDNKDTIHLVGSLVNNNSIYNFTAMIIQECGATFTNNGLLFGNPIYNKCGIWDGEAGDQKWSNPINWSGDSLPYTGGDIIIPSGEIVHVDTNVLITGTLDVGSNATLYVDGGKTFTLRSTLSSTAFDFNSSSSLVNNGTIDLEDGQLSTQGADFINNGTFNVLEDPGDFTVRGSASVDDVTNNGLIRIEGSVSAAYSDIVNNGEIVIDGMFLDWYGSEDYSFVNNASAEIRGTGILNIGSMNSPDTATGQFYNFGTIALNPRGSGLDPNTIIRNYTTINNHGVLGSSGEILNEGTLINGCYGTIYVTVTGNAYSENLCVDLTLTKTGPSQHSPGGSFSYQIGVTNAGPDDAGNARVTDTLPDGVHYVRDTLSGGWCEVDSQGYETCTMYNYLDVCGEADGIVECSLYETPEGSSYTLTIYVHVDEDVLGTITNTASVSGRGEDTNPSDNSDSVNTLILDNVPPVVTTPSDITAEATGPSGATVSYPAATATDNVDGTLTPTCTPYSGSTFALGDTTITCSATDAAGNTGTADFTISVVDTTPPTLTVPSTITTEATSASGAAVSYSVSADDVVDGPFTPECSPVSGSTFPLGLSLVFCDATDDAGNAIYAAFFIRVEDTIPPVVTPPADVTVEATGPDGAVVVYSGESAMDIVDGPLTPTCIPASGSLFPLFGTTANCVAVDTAGNVGMASFEVFVEDTTPPVLTIPADITVEATSQNGQTIFIGVATATDIVDLNPAITNNAPTDYFLGTRVVTWTATDDWGNSVSLDQQVTVVDTTPPDLTIPPDVTVEASAHYGQMVDIGVASATDIADSAPVITNNAPALFLLGPTVVTWTATDASGNWSSADQVVTVVDTIPPELTVPDDITVSAPTPAGAEVPFVVEVNDIADPNPGLVCTHLSGELFPLGTTVVSCTATDGSGNSTNDSFAINVIVTAETFLGFISEVEPLDLHRGTENSLVSKIEAALGSFERGNFGATINELEAFINQVNALEGIHISAEDAALLRSYAMYIIDFLGG